eukprot:14337371-Heterocapsa_arctica.AAC.1
MRLGMDRSWLRRSLLLEALSSPLSSSSSLRAGTLRRVVDRPRRVVGVENVYVPGDVGAAPSARI